MLRLCSVVGRGRTPIGSKRCSRNLLKRSLLKISQGAWAASWITPCSPICDSIHTLEADKPLLGQLLPTWWQLEEGFKVWVVKYPNLKIKRNENSRAEGHLISEGVLITFSSRFNKHYQPGMAAAYCLDPINFLPQSSNSNQMCPPFAKLNESEYSDVISTIKRLSGAPTDDAVDLEIEKLEMCDWSKRMNAAASAMVARPGEPLKSFDVHRNFYSVKSDFELPYTTIASGKLIGFHATTGAVERNWNLWGRIYTSARNSLDPQRAEKLVFIKANTTTTRGSDQEDSNDDNP